MITALIIGTLPITIPLGIAAYKNREAIKKWPKQIGGKVRSAYLAVTGYPQPKFIVGGHQRQLGYYSMPYGMDWDTLSEDEKIDYGRQDVNKEVAQLCEKLQDPKVDQDDIKRFLISLQKKYLPEDFKVIQRWVGVTLQEFLEQQYKLRAEPRTNIAQIDKRIDVATNVLRRASPNPHGETIIDEWGKVKLFGRIVGAQVKKDKLGAVALAAAVLSFAVSLPVVVPLIWRRWQERGVKPSIVKESCSTVLEPGRAFTLPERVASDSRKQAIELAFRNYNNAGRLSISGVIFEGERLPFGEAALLGNDLDRSNGTVQKAVKDPQRPLNVLHCMSYLELSKERLVNYAGVRPVLQRASTERPTDGKGIWIRPWFTGDHCSTFLGYNRMLSYENELELLQPFVDRWLRHGEDLVPMCSGGKSRSVTLAIKALICTKVMSLAEISRLVSITRPQCEQGFPSRNKYQQVSIVNFYLQTLLRNQEGYFNLLLPGASGSPQVLADDLSMIAMIKLGPIEGEEKEDKKGKKKEDKEECYPEFAKEVKASIRAYWAKLVNELSRNPALFQQVLPLVSVSQIGNLAKLLKDCDVPADQLGCFSAVTTPQALRENTRSQLVKLYDEAWEKPDLRTNPVMTGLRDLLSKVQNGTLNVNDNKWLRDAEKIVRSKGAHPEWTKFNVQCRELIDGMFSSQKIIKEKFHDGFPVAGPGLAPLPYVPAAIARRVVVAHPVAAYGGFFPRGAAFGDGSRPAATPGYRH